jgi:hypothetical protein
MRQHFNVTVALIVALTASVTPTEAQNIAQYKAAVTRVFLWKYQALPIFRLNPVFPGSVLRLDNETLYLAPDRCYPGKQGGNYHRAPNYTDGQAVAVSATLQVRGQPLTKLLADISAGVGVKFATSTAITVSPLSTDDFRPDTASLRKINTQADCQIIPQLLAGTQGGYIVVSQVLHGVIRYAITLDVAGGVTAALKPTLLAKITNTFGIGEPEIGVGVEHVSFAVAASPAPMTLAVVPEALNFDELARITNYLQGKRGADLETAVEEALTATDASVLTRVLNQIRSVLGSEISHRDKWASDFVSGRKLMPIAAVRQDSQVDLRKVGTYAAAMQLLAE